MSSDFIKGKYLSGYPIPVSIDCTTKILDQMKKCICKININSEKGGTGFFCYIPSHDKKVIITNNHIIDEDTLKKNNKLEVKLYDDQKIEIELNDKKMYTNIEYDTTIIEIKKEEEKKITDYIDYIYLDENIYKDKEIINKSIYILQYPRCFTGSLEQIASVSYGIIKDKDKYNIYHLCSTNHGSSGSPILDLLNNKVIGIHIAGPKDNKNPNLGVDLNYPIKEFLNSKNLIKKENCISMILEIKEKDINQKIYYLDNTCKKYKVNEKEQEHNHDRLKELNESNTELFINDEKFKFNKYFIPKNKGNYKIKIKFSDNIKDCSFMFCDCENIIDIDLSSFDTKNVIDMKYMFYGCQNIKNLNLAFFNTKKVTDMTYMFYDCQNLKDLNLSFFNTKNVTNMEYMFFNCKNLQNLNLSSFNASNVTSMNSMFSCCKDIISLDLSSFAPEKITNMFNMFHNCINIQSIDLTLFRTTNVTNMSQLFYNCGNIEVLDLSYFTTENVNNMGLMFAFCKNIKFLDLSSFNTSKSTYMTGLFLKCEKLKLVRIKKGLNHNLIKELNEAIENVSIEEI